MKKIILLVVTVQLFGLVFLFAPNKAAEAFKANAYSYDAEITPSFFNIAPCPSCVTATDVPVSGGNTPISGAPTNGTTNPAVTSSAPVPSVSPCSTDAAIAADNARHR